jgi:hypothetical protein
MPLIKRPPTTKVVGKVPTIGKSFHTRAANLHSEVYRASGTLPMDGVECSWRREPLRTNRFLTVVYENLLCGQVLALRVQ